MATLRELGPQAFEIAPVDGSPAASPDRWVVLVDRNGKPVSALPPGTALADGTVPPTVLVAAADLSQGEAYASAAFAEYTDAVALVLTENGDGSDIAGVVSGPALARAMMRGAMRGPGSSLPGPPAIPWISRSCSYTEAGATCSTMMSFTARPAVMPSCDNLPGLAAHQFCW